MTVIAWEGASPVIIPDGWDQWTYDGTRYRRHQARGHLPWIEYEQVRGFSVFWWPVRQTAPIACPIRVLEAA